ncbi:hypothetical protein DH2020_044930 [Rehmannia glutinosa]|uniref:Uncharacterized protein n=1 Tax=Rehmannia glutinosa TaxID=99300 RepID=A0ABR0UFJ2_REHGL
MAPSSALPSSSNNLPITGPNPKSRPRSDPPTVPPNSASSSSTTNAAPPDKRTRDLPNLSDCHCCGRRINYTNPKDRLQPLDSVWRIVLLCRKCRKKVGSGQTCPYCFKETGNSGDLLTCTVCERKIHKDCVRDYGNCTPWCFLGAGLEGFRVCVDCWVPELLKNSIKVCGRSESKGGSKDKGEANDLLKNLVKNAKYLLAKNGKDSSKAENLNCNGTIEVVDDAELAIQLHRAMNSSPRILRSKPVVNSNALDVLNIRHWNGLSYKRSRIGKNRSEDQKLGTFANNAENERMTNRLGENNSCIGVTGLNLGLRCYKRDKMRKIWQLDEDNTVVSDSSDADISEAPICVNADRNNVDRLGHELVIYKRSRFKRKLCQADGLVGVSGECCSLDNRGVAFLSESCKLDDTELWTGCQVKSDTEANLPSGSCNADRDRYHLKYSKRTTGTKSGSNFLHFGTFLSENQASAHGLNKSEAGTVAERHRYHLKYAKRATGTKPDSSFLHYGTLLGEKYQASAPALSKSPPGCSVKSDDKLILQNGTSKHPDRYLFKYTKRVKSSKSGAISETKLHADAFLKDIEASAARLTTNSSAESRTLSDVTFDSFNTDLPK